MWASNLNIFQQKQSIIYHKGGSLGSLCSRMLCHEMSIIFTLVFSSCKSLTDQWEIRHFPWHTQCPNGSPNLTLQHQTWKNQNNIILTHFGPMRVLKLSITSIRLLDRKIKKSFTPLGNNKYQLTRLCILATLNVIQFHCNITELIRNQDTLWWKRPHAMILNISIPLLTIW